MNKENLFKGIIVLAGTGIAYLKYNPIELLNIEYLLPIVSALIVVFISAIFLLNKKVYKLKTLVINSKLRFLIKNFKSNKSKEKIKTEKVHFQSDKTNVLKAIESILCISVAVVFGVVLGYYYKEPSAKMLRLALNEPSEWKKNLFLDWRRAKTSFFELKNNLYGGFEFNWIAFSIGIISIVLLYVIIKKTKLTSIIKVTLTPYIK